MKRRSVKALDDEALCYHMEGQVAGGCQDGKYTLLREISAALRCLNTGFIFSKEEFQPA